jgi:hypothetical protein
MGRVVNTCGYDRSWMKAQQKVDKNVEAVHNLIVRVVNNVT